MSLTEWLINNRNLFLAVLEAGKSKIKALADCVSGEVPLPDSQKTVFLLFLNLNEGGE